MHGNVKKESFRTLVKNPIVFAFSKKVLSKSYTECVPGYENEMQQLMEDAFKRLEEARHNEEQFNNTLAKLVKDLFRKDEPEFWFNKVYNSYKREFKPQRRYYNLQPWLEGKKVLDFGCGDGLTSRFLEKNGYQVYLTDVLDYRATEAKQYPFVHMENPRVLPYQDQKFDNGIILAVMHHMEDTDLLPILSNLHSLCRRLIVEEDCYLLANMVKPDLKQVLQRDHFLREFMELSVEDQLRYLMFVDFFANAITQGIIDMELPFNFRTVEEWQWLFEQQGFQVVETLILGFQEGFFNRSCHTWFILDAV
jgi:SAM-dependent methyltransferase